MNETVQYCVIVALYLLVNSNTQLNYMMIILIHLRIMESINDFIYMGFDLLCRNLKY